MIYLGYSGPDDRDVNKGQPVSYLENPVWVEPGKLYTTTVTYLDGQYFSGIFEVNFESNSFEYQSYSTFNFPHCIGSLRLDSQNDRLLITYSADGAQKAARIILSDERTIIDEELVGENWSPQSIASWPGKEGIIFYGTNPETGISGFYWRYADSTQAIADSLLYAINLESSTENQFSLSHDGSLMFMGLCSGRGPHAITRYLKLNLESSDNDPIVIAERKGEFISLSAHPKNRELLLISYFSYEGTSTGGHIEILNFNTQESKDLDVRTHKSLCRFIYNGDFSFSPSGDNFVFSAGAFTGEGDVYPFELWIYNNVID
ncbi:MAG: hypothetical protein R6U43_11695 [Candidatus Krumholzibacteriales bacterium]